MKAEIVIYKVKNKFGKEILLRGIKCKEVFNKLRNEEQFVWLHISNCMLNLNMKFEQLLENELYGNREKQVLINVYNSYLKDIISEYKIKKVGLSEQIKIRVTPEEKQNLQIMAKEKGLSISEFLRQKIVLIK
jgi:ribosome-associated toxin RatA of RatAB toxin-antitoxin module